MPPPNDAPAGEAPTSARHVFSVTELTAGLKVLVEEAYDDVWIEGELSDFHRARSGHCYFTLCDAEAQLRCVMWRHLTQYVFFEPEDGMRVRLHGHASLYERRGSLQLVCQSMQLAGEGALQKAFEELKEKLSAEGLFDAAHKKPLPPFPETVGLVTSGGSAALHDMRSILERRFAQARVVVCPVRVQGLGAAKEIAAAVAAFGALPEDDPRRPDVLLVGRGGGAAEDLWAFNEEAVARALFASPLPIVSGVGHETDTTITDFVADVRAATPSMAAELAVPDSREVTAHVRSLHRWLDDRLREQVRRERSRLDSLTASRAFHRPVEQLRRQQQRLDDLTGRLHRAARHRMQQHRSRLDALRSRLQAADPEAPLRRGYARVEKEGRPVRTAAALSGGERITLRLRDGRRTATVEPPSADAGGATPPPSPSSST